MPRVALPQPDGDISPASFAHVRNTTLHYRPHQTSSGRPLTLLLVHGFGASGESWHDITPLLVTKCNLVRIDLKGFGFSDKPPESIYTLHEQAALIAEFSRNLSHDDLVLVGHSYGGAAIFMAYLRLRSQKLASHIKGLVFVDSASYLQRLPFFVAPLRNSVTRWLTNTLTTPEWRTRFVLRRIFVDKTRVDCDRVRRYAHFLRLPGADQALVRAAAAIVPPDAAELSELLKSLDRPTQIVWGASDPVIPLQHALRLNADVPGSRLDIIPATGHVPHEEKPMETAEAILSFIQEI